MIIKHLKNSCCGVKINHYICPNKLKLYTMKTFLDTLQDHNACEPAMDWMQQNNYTTIEDAWNNCERGDWLLWLYKKLNPSDLQGLTLAKGHCASTVLHLMKDQRSKDAVKAAIDFGNGEISREELSAAAAAAAYAAAAAAADADADAAAAAYAAAAAAADADAAKKENQKQTADICRQYLTIPKI